MDSEVRQLRRAVRILKLYSVALTSAAFVALLAAFRGHRPNDQIIRAHGLVIVDAAGRERILTGAPIPAAANRVRTDTARVRQIWGPGFPKEHLTYYKTYRNSMNGMLVLDEHGFDRDRFLRQWEDGELPGVFHLTRPKAAHTRVRRVAS